MRVYMKSRVKMVAQDQSHWNMMAFLFQIILIFHQLGDAYAQDSISTSNGRDFYIGYMRNFAGTSFTTLRLWIGTTSTENVEYVIESRGEIIQQKGTVNSTSPTTVAIDANFQVTDSNFENREKGLHIYITTDTGSIYVIADNSVSPHNQGVFLAYPCLTFNEDEYEYYVISTEVVSTPQSQLLLVGCENDTKISITPSQPITLPRDLQSSNTLDSISLEAEDIHNVTIHQLQTVLISSNGDLTGTRIVSSKPLSVIAGHQCGNVPSNTTGCEPFAVQVPPSFTWGNKFILASFGGRDADTVFKFVSTVPTNVVIACEQTLRLTNITEFQFAVSASMYCSLHSSEPILLVQLATSGSGDGRGDPAIALVSPVDQYVHNISFLAPPANTFSGVYISVTVSTEYYSSDSIFYNGEVLDCTWKEIYGDNSTVTGYGCNYTITNLRTDLPSQHVVSHLEPNGLISVLVYAFSTSNIGLAYLTGQEITAGFIGDGNDGNIGDFVEFFDITEFPGVAELDRDVLDGASEAIIIPNGLWFGQDIVTEAFVNENGVISFNEPWGFSYPDPFPTDYYWTQIGKAIAPFWSDNDIRKEGHVRYATYCNITDTTGCSYHAEGQAILDEVNLFIQANRGADADFFAGDWMLIAQWDHVHPYPHGSDNTQGIREEVLSKTNTYQAIVVSDTIHTSMIFTYICGDLQWSAFGSSRNAAVVGYNSAGNRYFNHPLSGYTSIGESLSCAIRLGKRRKRQSVRGSSILKDVQTAIAECSNMLGFDAHTDVDNYVSMLEPCPCIKSQADLDTARFRPQTDSVNCYVSMKPLSTTPDVLTSMRRMIVQQCCYDDNGALITTESVDAGSLLFQHPLREPTKYNKLRDQLDVTFGDKTFKMTCCTGYVQGKDFCLKFFQRRPNNNCSGYRPPVVGTGWGDPHFTTFDGLKFDFQGIGDFTVFKTLSPSITVQGRMETIIDGRKATWHTGLAFGDTDKSFEVTGTNNWPTGWRIVESNNEITDQLPPVSRWPDDDTTLVQLRRDRNNKLTADFFKSGISLIINLHWYKNFNYFSYKLKVPTSYMRQVRGLLGNFDGSLSIDRELFTRENQPVPYTSDQGVYSAMTSWMVTESLLFCNAYVPVPNDDDHGTRKRRQAPNAYTPTFFDNLNFNDTQRTLCENNRQCLYDLFITEDNDVAQTTLDTEKETNMTIATLNNFPPNISAEATLRVNLGEQSVLALSLVDSDDNFTLNIQDGLPDSPILEKISDGEYFFMWTLQQVTNKTLVFIANDTRGAASLFIPTVEICACVNEGVCTLDGLLTSNTTVVMNCLCSEAYDGRFCQEDRNGCSEIQCFEGVECMDIPAPGVGAVCGDCPLGYTGDLLKYYDIDECFLDANLCEQVCTNTDGGFVCSCVEGYQLMANQCEDINECHTINDCQQLCLNTEGSYTCSCNEGFNLSTDGRNCTADFPCNGSCSFACAVIDGLEQCYCQNGFQLDIVNETLCIDQNECQESNPCEHECTNNKGSFSCSCSTGYQLLSDGKRCEDIDECFQAAFISTDLCENDPNSQCINTEGSFECTCAAGYNNLTINGSCQRVRNEPPPKVDFTPDRQQLFRETTAIAVNNYCTSVSCKLILPSGEIQKVTQLVIFSANVAIPTSLIKKKDGENMMFVVFVQVDEAYLSKDNLEYAIMNAAELYKMNGFLPTFELTPSTPTVWSGSALIGVIVGVIAVPIVLVILILLAVLCKKCCFNKSKINPSHQIELSTVVDNPFQDKVDKDHH